MRICQLLNLLAALFLISCSTPKVEEKHDERQISAHWLRIPLRFALRDKNEDYITHPFFDVDPTFKKEARSLNFFVTTPEDSAYKYNFDIYSGRLYKEHDYCLVEDIWDLHKGDLDKPNFTQGIVPRIYDQNGNPQKIIIFGNKNIIEKFKYDPTNYDTAKIIGSIIIESCQSYPCDTKSKWKASQVLVAVNSRDQDQLNLNSLDELKPKVDWSYARSVLVNQEGVHQIGRRYYPAFRISRELNPEETIKYFEQNSTQAKISELLKWREECFKLYDSIWDKTEKIRVEKSGQQEKFLKFFRDFYSKEYNQFYSCQKLVRPANINEDPRRMWFFVYLQAFANLEKANYFYSCSQKSWSYNPKIDEGHYFNNQTKELERCRPRDFEKMFDQAINGLALLKNQSNKNYRFIEYDTQHGGSHQKIYSWIAEEGKVHACKNKSSQTKEQFDLFPQDVQWLGFKPDSTDELIK